MKKTVGTSLISGGIGVLSTIEPVSGVVASICKDSYKALSEQRAVRFFNKVEKSLHEQDEGETAEFIKKLNESDTLKEFLFDFTNAALQTRSELAITMLALAYIELSANALADEVSLEICRTIPFATERELLLFEILFDHFVKPEAESEDFAEKPCHVMKMHTYKICYIRPRLYHNIIIEQHEFSENEIIPLIDRLISKGFLASKEPKETSAYLYAFSFNEYTVNLGNILKRAKTLI